MDPLVSIFLLFYFSVLFFFDNANDDISLRTIPTYQKTVGIRATLANKLAN
jgi:hypothetical protein